MDTVTLSRLQFAFTIGFHILWPTVTVGLGCFVTLLSGLWWRTGRPVYRNLLRFWQRIFALTFGMGVVTGVVLSYEIGTSWVGFSRSVGHVLGPQGGAEFLLKALRRAGDEFVGRWVARIVSSRAWTKKSVIFITTDETTYNGNKMTGGWLDANACCDAPVVPKGFKDFPQGGQYGGGLVPMIVISGIGKKRFVSNVVHNHYSVLRTIEESWGLGYLGMAADANQVRSMWEFFRL